MNLVEFLKENGLNNELFTANGVLSLVIGGVICRDKSSTYSSREVLEEKYGDNLPTDETELFACGRSYMYLSASKFPGGEFTELYGIQTGYIGISLRSASRILTSYKKSPAELLKTLNSLTIAVEEFETEAGESKRQLKVQIEACHLSAEDVFAEVKALPDDYELISLFANS